MAGNKWQISDELWEKMAPLLPEHKTHHPLGTHRKRVDNRAAMNAIFFVLRSGCQWNALNATGICSSSSAHRRFRRVLTRWEKKVENYEAMLHFTCGIIIWNKILLG
ncbi:transposase [Rahnella contaminans]|nr:transposase [Rahnella contaminans]MDF1897281.1 transposase [Rahnella contaminans]